MNGVGVSPDPSAAAGRAVLQALWLGRCAYEDALARQEDARAAVAEGRAEQQVLLLEHSAVYTLGRGADEGDLRGAPRSLGVPVFRVGRGGGATFHGPGQLVAYPIVRLRSGGRDVHGYVRTLEQSLVDTCATFGVAAVTRVGEPGVWVGNRKIGSIGIGVRRGVAWHGIALNVATDLSYFDAIVVCRSTGLRLVNLADLVADPPSVRVAGAVFAAALARRLGLLLEETPWP